MNSLSRWLRANVPLLITLLITLLIQSFSAMALMVVPVLVPVEAAACCATYWHSCWSLSP